MISSLFPVGFWMEPFISFSLPARALALAQGASTAQLCNLQRKTFNLPSTFCRGLYGYHFFLEITRQQTSYVMLNGPIIQNYDVSFIFCRSMDAPAGLNQSEYCRG